MKLKTTLATLTLAMIMPVTALASEGAERLSQLLEPLQSLEAGFEQQILDGSGQRLQEARGQMWLSRPGRFRWEVEAPYRQVVVSDGDEVFLHDPDLEQVTVQPLDTRVTHTPALLLSGRVEELTENYEVSSREQGQTETFSLRPRNADTLFEELTMTFRDERLDALQMTDSTGQRTAINFTGVRMNAGIDDARFDFQIPEGADVIRENAQ